VTRRDAARLRRFSGHAATLRRMPSGERRPAATKMPWPLLGRATAKSKADLWTSFRGNCQFESEALPARLPTG